MKCKGCDASLRDEVLLMGCVACGQFASYCSCKSELGYLPDRRVRCIVCHRSKVVDTQKNDWQGTEV